MNRKQFLNTFNEYFQKNENPFYFFNILVKDSSNKLEFNEAIFLHFMPFFQEIKIKNKIDLIKNLNFQKQYDSYFEEDNPSSEFCCFNCHLNINQLFDQIKKLEGFSSNLTKIYRLETSLAHGLYDSFFASKKINLDNQPCPFDDPTFIGIFDRNHNDYKYQKEWFFGFSDKKDLLNWISDASEPNLLSQLQSKGIVIKEYIIDDDFVINGHKQLIFQKSQHQSSCIISWDELFSQLQKKLTF